ncbi:prominin-like protein isoform X3 [Bombyx mori]|uniref:Prominin-like protein n=1 Tax=Bombyx mori TaxID=7091 RepID=A0A8R2M3D1_BOMMO|nr:prominin-like protein isoform X3 [Bombyx mori]
MCRFLVLVFWVCLWRCSRAEIGHDMNKISQQLILDMSDVMDLATPNYSTPIINTTYVASLQFDMRAMGPLYNSTHMIIDAIANKQAYPEGIVSVSDGHLDIASPRDNWKVLLAHYAGPTAIVVVTALVIAALPLAGLFWCCCYWCRVGRRRRPFDRKYDACLKGILAILLIGLLTLFLFGVVCAFATDSQVEDGMADAPDSLRDGIRDAQEFLNATQAHARWLLVVNYRELKDALNAVLRTSGMTVALKLGEFSHAASVSALSRMVARLDDVRADLRAVHALTDALRHHADALNAGLRKVKNQLLQTLARCDQPNCKALQNKYKLGQLDTEIHYSQMPDVSPLLSSVSVLLEGHIQEEVAAGQQVFRDIQYGIRRSIDTHIPDVQNAIEETGRKLEGIAEQITQLAGNASARLASDGGGAADALRSLHARYGPYRRHAGLAAALALLAITLLLVWGLVCGVCGKRPDAYGAADCCNKGAGARCLLCGVGATLAAGGAVALVLLVHFAAGLAAQRFVCDPLTEPRGNRLFEDLEKFVDLEKMLFNERLDPNFNMTSVLLQCHMNHTIYETLQLRRVYDVEELRRALGAAVGARVRSLRARYPQEAARGRVTLLRDPAKLKLTELANTQLSDFDFDKILDALESNLTTLSLEELGERLTSAAGARGLAGSREGADLRRAAAALAQLHADLLLPMRNYTLQLNRTATKLRDELRFNQSSLKAAILYHLHETNEAEDFLNNQGPQLLENITAAFAAVVEREVGAYGERLSAAAARHVGRCGPLSAGFNATRDALCTKLLLPANGYWMSLAWGLLVLVPVLVVAQRLAGLYLQADPYPGPLVEAEYLYDAYADRDNVPLANSGSKRSTLDIEGKIAEWRDRAVPSAPPPHSPPPSPPHSRTQLLLAGEEVVCQLVAPPPGLIDDLKTRLDAKDEDNESGIHESE